jgi:hypothetical protein
VGAIAAIVSSRSIGVADRIPLSAEPFEIL